MEDKFKILWLEEDYLDAIEAAIQAKGIIVKRAFFISDAVKLLAEEKFDLLLLDVMIPIEKEDIEIGFTEDATDKGKKSGLEFYRRYKKELSEKGIPILVYTIRGSMAEIRKSFKELGLLEDNYLDKVDNSNVNFLLSHIERVLQYKKH